MFDLMKYASSTAMVEGENTYSYRDLFAESEKIAGIIGERTVVFLLATNTFASVAAYAGCLNHRIVPVMLDANQHTALLAEMLAAYKPSALWVPENRLEDFLAATSTPQGGEAPGQVLPEARPGQGIEAAGKNPRFEEAYRSHGYVLLRALSPCPFPLCEELALLITTSGSTGSPKLVRQSYKNLLANTASIIEYLHITKKERAITSLPMNYVYGLSVINTHLFAGATLILTQLNCYSPKFWKLCQEEAVTSFAGVPFMYEMLAKLKVLKTRELPALRTLTQAGGKLSPELHRQFAEYAANAGKSFVVMYGASEATARMGYLPPEMALEKTGSMGVVIPGGRFELLNAEGEPVEDESETGELVYYGDNVTLGYAERGEDLALGDVNQGRLATGDMARRDADGYYYIVGRKKRFVKLLGKRLNLDELERNLKNELATIDVACAGKDDLLQVFLTKESLVEAATSYVFDKVGVSRGLFRVLVIPEIPKNPSGKTLYSQLSDMLS